MSAKTKLVVLRMKELIYTGIFVLLAVLLLILVYVMVCKGGKVNQRDEKAAATGAGTVAEYVPGVYTSVVSLGQEQAEVMVTVSSHEIRSVSLRPLSETVTAMYPLVEPAIQNLADQIVDTQSLDHLTCRKEQQYTSRLLLKAVASALKKSRIS